MTYNNREYRPTNITTGTTTSVFSGKGVLQAVTVNTTAAGTIIIKDGTTVVATLKSSIAEGTYWFNTTIAGGLNIVTGSTSDITVTWVQ